MRLSPQCEPRTFGTTRRAAAESGGARCAILNAIGLLRASYRRQQGRQSISARLFCLPTPGYVCIDEPQYTSQYIHAVTGYTRYCYCIWIFSDILALSSALV
jgi:hypothetical protein